MKRLILKLTFPLAHLYWQIFKPKTFGVKVIIENNNQFLLIKNSYGGDRWTFPGGGIEKGESAIDAAMRETSEEVGITLDKNMLGEVGSYVTTHEGKIDTVHVFKAEGGGEIVVDGQEVIQAAWFPKDGLPENLGLQARKSLAVWNNK